MTVPTLPAGVGSVRSAYAERAFNASTPFTFVEAEDGKRPVALLTYRHDYTGGSSPEESQVQTSSGARAIAPLTALGTNGEPHTVLVIGDVGEGLDFAISGSPTAGSAYLSYTYGYLPG